MAILGVLAILFGAIMLYAALQDKSIGDLFRSVISG